MNPTDRDLRIQAYDEFGIHLQPGTSTPKSSWRDRSSMSASAQCAHQIRGENSRQGACIDPAQVCNRTLSMAHGPRLSGHAVGRVWRGPAPALGASSRPICVFPTLLKEMIHRPHISWSLH